MVHSVDRYRYSHALFFFPTFHTTAQWPFSSRFARLPLAGRQMSSRCALCSARLPCVYNEHAVRSKAGGAARRPLVSSAYADAETLRFGA